MPTETADTRGRGAAADAFFEKCRPIYDGVRPVGIREALTLAIDAYLAESELVEALETLLKAGEMSFADDDPDDWLVFYAATADATARLDELKGVES